MTTTRTKTTYVLWSYSKHGNRFDQTRLLAEDNEAAITQVTERIDYGLHELEHQREHQLSLTTGLVAPERIALWVRDPVSLVWNRKLD